MDPEYTRLTIKLVETADQLKSDLYTLRETIRADSGFVDVWRDRDGLAPPHNKPTQSTRDYIAWVLTEMDFFDDCQGKDETPMAPGVYEVSEETVRQIAVVNACKESFKIAGLEIRQHLVANHADPERATKILRKRGHSRINRRQAYRMLSVAGGDLLKIQFGWYNHVRVARKSRANLLEHLGRVLAEDSYQAAKRRIEAVPDLEFAIVQNVEGPRPRAHIKDAGGSWNQYQTPLPIAIPRGAISDWATQYTPIPTKKEALTRRPNRGRAALSADPIIERPMVHQYKTPA